MNDGDQWDNTGPSSRLATSPPTPPPPPPPSRSASHCSLVLTNLIRLHRSTRASEFSSDRLTFPTVYDQYGKEFLAKMIKKSNLLAEDYISCDLDPRPMAGIHGKYKGRKTNKWFNYIVDLCHKGQRASIFKAHLERLFQNNYYLLHTWLHCGTTKLTFLFFLSRVQSCLRKSPTARNVMKLNVAKKEHFNTNYYGVHVCRLRYSITKGGKCERVTWRTITVLGDIKSIARPQRNTLIGGDRSSRGDWVQNSFCPGKSSIENPK